MPDNAGVRKQNLNQVRRVLWQGGQYTKLDISRATGLSAATCNTLLNELEKAGEVVGQSRRIRDVGRSSIVYQYNEEAECFLGVSYQLIGGVKSVRIAVISPLGRVVQWYERQHETLDYAAVESLTAQAVREHPNASQILVGTPSIAEHGVVRHCDIPEMEGVPLVRLLEERFGLPVYMQNDIHYKAYGYYKKEGKENDIVTLAFFPSGVLPGTASVYQGTILKGHNQFAGMVGFLPYEFDRAEEIRLLTWDTAIPVIVKAAASLIAAINPSTILFAGDLLDGERIKQVYDGCLTCIPREYMPEFHYTDQIDDYYLLGMYHKALDRKETLT